MNIFLSGVFTTLALVVSLFFANFYRKTKDRLFACFALSFFMLGVERIVITIFSITQERGSEVYLIRLVSLVLILWAIIDKNRRGERGF